MDLKQYNYSPAAHDLPLTVKISAGLFGYHSIQNYVVKKMPGPAILSPFRLLESTNNPSVLFVVKPIDNQDKLIEEADVQQAISDLSFSNTAAQAYAIVTLIRQNDEHLGFYLNLKAPIIVDWSKKIAEQYVFTNNKYTLQHRWQP